MSMIMPTTAVLCPEFESPVVLPAAGVAAVSAPDASWQLVAPMTSQLGTGLSGHGVLGESFGYGSVREADLVPTDAPFAATRPSAVIPMTPARDVRTDVRADVEAAKQASRPRGVPR